MWRVLSNKGLHGSRSLERKAPQKEPPSVLMEPLGGTFESSKATMNHEGAGMLIFVMIVALSSFASSALALVYYENMSSTMDEVDNELATQAAAASSGRPTSDKTLTIVASAVDIAVG